MMGTWESWPMEGGHSVIVSMGDVGCCWFEPLFLKVLLLPSV